jgi:hypothetical protein
VNGTFSGQSLAPQDANARVQTATMAGATITSADILIGSVGSLCALAQRHANPPGYRFLELVVGGPGTQIAPGTYALYGGNEAMFGSALFGSEDARCAATLSEIGLSGTITISDASASSVSGSFDVTFHATSSTGMVGGSADHVTGSFNASVCNVTPMDAGAPACGP